MAPARRGRPAPAVLLVALAAAQLFVYLRGGSGQAWVGVLVGAACLLVLPVTVALWTGRMPECRLFAVILAIGMGGTQVLAMTVGSPGGTPLGWSLGRGVVVALAVAVVLLVLRSNARSCVGDGGSAADTYASSDGTAAAGRGGRRRYRRAAATDPGA